MGTFFGENLPSKNGRSQSRTWLLPLNFALLAFSPFTTGNETTCETSASEGSLQIACNFPQNINKTKSSFCVYNFKPNGTSVALACNWLDDELSCFTDQGFTTPNQVSNSFITKVEGYHHGDFACDILPQSAKSNIGHCVLPFAHKGSVELLGDSQANAKNMSMDAKNNSAVNNDPVDCNHWGGPWICSLLFLIILNLMLMLLIFFMKWNNSTEVLKVVLQWCRRPKHKQQKETPYKKSEVSTEANHIGAITETFINDRRTPGENQPLSPHRPEQATSHQNGSVKKSIPFNDISVSVQRRTPDEKQPWSSFGPEKFRNGMYSVSMHNWVQDDMS